MKSYFFDLCEFLQQSLKGEETFTCFFEAEDSDFSRFNTGLIRQIGSVKQGFLKLRLILGEKQVTRKIGLSLEKNSDCALVNSTMTEIRSYFSYVPDDPFLFLSTEINSTSDEKFIEGINAKQAVSNILGKVKGLDFVGVFASGQISRGFANGFGQRNWFQTHFFSLDGSVYQDQAAAKVNYSGHEWKDAGLDSSLESAKESVGFAQAKVIEKPPGEYRVYLSPAAVHEIISLLNWQGFGLKSKFLKTSPLILLAEGQEKFSKKISIWEDSKQSMGPKFDDCGFIKEDTTSLVRDGRYSGSLVSARSAKEFGVSCSGASNSEAGESLVMKGGVLDAENILDTLYDGIYISNLWYLNYSDRMSCRLTGMTRFATLVVEGGKIKGPMQVMRFDESMYRVLGSQLEDLSKDQELIVSTDTYSLRSTDSMKLPGMIVNNFTFTL